MADIALNTLPEKRIVTFGEETAATQEQRLNSQWHIKFIALTIGLPALVALAYAAIMNASMAAGLATTIPWKIGIGLLAAAFTLSLGALPIAAGLLWDKDNPFPAYAALALLLLIPIPISLMAAGGHAYHALHSYRARSEPAPDDRALLDFDPFKGKRFRFENKSNGRWYEFGVPDLVRRTNGCRDLSYDPFEYNFQKEFCKDWRLAESAERKRRAAGVGVGTDDDGPNLEGMFSRESITWARRFLAIWGPFAAVLFALLGFAVAGGAIAKMLLISEPPTAEAPTFDTEPNQPVYDNQSIFEDWCFDCVGKDENAPILKPPAILASYTKWANDNGYPLSARLSDAKLFEKFKEKYGKHFRHRGSQGGSLYVGLILKG